MMRYQYKPTGAVIEITSELHSPDWERLPEDAAAENPAEESKTPKPKKKAVKGDGDDKLRAGQ